MSRIVPDCLSRGFDFVQNNVPTNPWKGCIWFKPATRTAYIFNGIEWDTMFRFDYNVAYGYSVGGFDGYAGLSSVERFAFAIRSGLSVIQGYLPDAVRGLPSGFNSQTSGYVAGGLSSDLSITFSSVRRFEFTVDFGEVTAVGTLTQPVFDTSGGNSSVHGYVVGGREGDTRYSHVQRMAFATEGTAAVVGDLGYGERGALAAVNSSTDLYAIAGFNGTAWWSGVDKAVFPFDSGTTARVGSLSYPLAYNSGCNSSTIGYSVAGSSEGYLFDTVTHLPFPFSGTAGVSLSLTYAKSMTGAFNSTSHGFVTGGDVGTMPFVKAVEMFDFAVNANAIQQTDLERPRRGHCGLDNTDFVYQFTA